MKGSRVGNSIFIRSDSIRAGVNNGKALVMTVDRFILTGPPGSGKTTILRQLAEKGFATRKKQRLT
jgi:nucleoside-triphosphatase THEP1